MTNSHDIQATVKETSGTRDKSGTVPNKSSRVTGVNVFLLQKYTPGSKVPKNEDREELRKAERNKIVYISRNDDSSHVEEKIKSAFGLRNKYNILESDSKGCKLSLSPLTSLDGNQAIRRRKALYLCEVSNLSCLNEVHMRIHACMHVSKFYIS